MPSKCVKHKGIQWMPSGGWIRLSFYMLASIQCDPWKLSWHIKWGHVSYVIHNREGWAQYVYALFTNRVILLGSMIIPHKGQGSTHQENLCSKVQWVNIGLYMDVERRRRNVYFQIWNHKEGHIIFLMEIKCAYIYYQQHVDFANVFRHVVVMIYHHLVVLCSRFLRIEKTLLRYAFPCSTLPSSHIVPSSPWFEVLIIDHRPLQIFIISLILLMSCKSFKSWVQVVILDLWITNNGLDHSLKTTRSHTCFQSTHRSHVSNH